MHSAGLVPQGARATGRKGSRCTSPQVCAPACNPLADSITGSTLVKDKKGLENAPRHVQQRATMARREATSVCVYACIWRLAIRSL